MYKYNIYIKYNLYIYNIYLFIISNSIDKKKMFFK